MGLQPSKRHDTISLFSTFLDLRSQDSAVWTSDGRLRRHMQAHVQHRPDATEMDWAHHWLSRWRDEPGEPHSWGHLVAYLQEACYWAAWRVHGRFTSAGARTSCTLAELFQAGQVKLPVILQRYNPRFGRGVAGYAFQAFKNTIRDELHRQELTSTSSDWALLRGTGRGFLTAALRRAGLQESAIEQHVLAWMSYRELYVPADGIASRALTGPDPETWRRIAEDFNRRRTVHLQPPGPEAETEDMRQWLADCARAVRAHRPRFVAIDAGRPGWDDDEGLPIPTPSALDAVLRREEQNLATEVGRVLRDALDTLDPTRKQLLDIYYGQGLNQVQIARYLGRNQPAISRQLSACRAELVGALGRWSQDALGEALTSDTLKELGAAVDEWLQEHHTREQQREVVGNG